MKPLHARYSQNHHQDAFVLVIALTLMAFVLLLVLSMATLIRIEAQATNRSLQVLQARENARLALMLAIGQLQKHAGLDQRVTARADILGDGSFAPTARFWTGVWDTRNPTAIPVWLVSGANTNPNKLPTQTITIQLGYDQANDGNLSKTNEYAATQVPLENYDDANLTLAWWIIDEGVKAPVTVKDELLTKLEGHDVDAPYLDYSPATNRILPIVNDPVFEFPELFNFLTAKKEDLDRLDRIISIKQIENIAAGMDPDAQKNLQASFHESVTLKTAFVLANSSEGGLKKDLSFLKTVDAASYSQEDIDATYSDPDQLLTPDFIKAIQFRGNPTIYPKDEVMGLSLSEDTLVAIESKTADFTLAPVITEFQFSCGIAADDNGLHKKETQSTSSNSDVYFIYKLYLEIWNPYTIPMQIGQEALPAHLGYSDLLVKISNLPSYSIENVSSPISPVTGDLPEISILWSEHVPYKRLKPGMVFEQTLPLDSKGSQDSGVIRMSLGTTILGSYDNNFVGLFSFSASPVKIVIYGLKAGAHPKEILTAEISGYPNFEIDYDSSNTRTRFKRKMSTTSSAIGGMTKASLEEPLSYAFAFRFRMLDEQDTLDPFEDISKWLSQADFRHQRIVVDLKTWDPNDAWTEADTLPYDFFLNDETSAPDYYDPGQFNPAESFRATDFFQYAWGDGRSDRIARFVDLPSSEIINIGSLRALYFTDFPINAIGNQWGGDLNKLYDRYFFSTLPNPDNYQLKDDDVLANPNLRALVTMPTLIDPEAAKALHLENGFNLNSTSIDAWQRVLSGKQFLPETINSCYEISTSLNTPEWFLQPDAVTGVFFNNPHTAAYNLSEKANDPSYTLITRKTAGDHASYLSNFSINNLNWQNDRQFPAFFQPIRELRNEDIEALSSAIVDELITYTQTTNHPPLSIADFLNSGIFEKAINQVSAINNRQNNQDYIPSYTPASISQATLMNAIGAKSFVRSDTFKIRAYGETKNPTTGLTVASAMCEATIQRLPIMHTDSSLGREFQVLNIRWIDPNL